MKWTLLIISIIFVCSFNGYAQPSPGTYGDAVFNGRHHAMYTPIGWDSTRDFTVIFFGGDGQDPANFPTQDDVAPMSMLSAGQWDGTIPLIGGGGNRKFKIIEIGNSGNQPAIYAADIAYFFQNLAHCDTSDHSRITYIGLSGGPARFWDFLTNGASSGVPTNSPYRFCFGTTISMSCSSIFFSLTPIANNKKHYVFYGNPDGLNGACGGSYRGDGNCGTPYSASSILYSGLPGTANVDKRIKWNPVGTHSNNTWGIWNDSATALNVVAADTVHSLWKWVMYAYGSPGVNLNPTAQAGTTQFVTLPTSTATLNGSGSFDSDGSIASYAWTKISGPSGGTITSASSVSTGITSLQAGLYKYRLVVTDNAGGTDDDTTYISVVNGVPSATRINFTLADFVNLTAKKNPEYWINGDTTDKIENEFNINNVFANPMQTVFFFKDSSYDNIRVRRHLRTSSTSYNYIFRFYDSTRSLLGTFPMSGGNVGWMDLPGRPDTIVKSVRYMTVECSDVQTGVNEIQVYADRAVKNSKIIPSNPTPTILADPGIKMQGGSDQGGKDTNYLKTSSGFPLYASYRSPSNKWNYANSQLEPFNQQQYNITAFGDYGAYISFMKRIGVQVMLYSNGGSAKASNAAYSVANGYASFLPLNNIKDIPPGSDSTSYAVWASNTARMWKTLAYMWGYNTSAVLPPNYVINAVGGTDVSAGQGKVKIWEIGNENDKNWQGGQGFFSPRVQLYELLASRDSILSIDPTAKIASGALLSFDTLQWRAMATWNWLDNGVFILPVDFLNANQYMSDTYGGQPQGGVASGVSPEQFQWTNRIEGYKKARDTYAPGAALQWTEFGYVPGSGSDYKVHAVTGFPDSMVVANFNIRCYERSAMVPNGITSAYLYKHTSDGNGTFAGMKVVVEKFDDATFAYLYSNRTPNWWWLATRMNILHDYKGWVTTIQDGDSTTKSLTRYDHKTDPLKKVYAIWMGTYNGSTLSNQVVNVGNASSATLVTMLYGSQSGTQTSLSIVGGNVTVPTVNEGPQYLIVQLNASVPPTTNFRVRGTRFRLKK